jgi:hypothetical protein
MEDPSLLVIGYWMLGGFLVIVSVALLHRGLQLTDEGTCIGCVMEDQETCNKCTRRSAHEELESEAA